MYRIHHLLEGLSLSTHFQNPSTPSLASSYSMHTCTYNHHNLNIVIGAILRPAASLPLSRTKGNNITISTQPPNAIIDIAQRTHGSDANICIQASNQLTQPPFVGPLPVQLAVFIRMFKNFQEFCNIISSTQSLFVSCCGRSSTPLYV